MRLRVWLQTEMLDDGVAEPQTLQRVAAARDSAVARGLSAGVWPGAACCGALFGSACVK